MAYTKHVTLVAATVTPITLAANAARIEVLNRDGVAEVYFTTNGVDPVVGADNTHVLAAAIGALEVADETSGQNSVVKLISAGTPKVSVRAF